MTIAVVFTTSIATDDVVFVLELRDDVNSLLMRTDTSITGQCFDLPTGMGIMHFGVEKLPVLDGAFTYNIGIQSRGGVLFDWREPAGSFEVMNPGKTTGNIFVQVHAALIPSDTDPANAPVSEELSPFL
jgi:hypothetical protein